NGNFLGGTDMHMSIGGCNMAIDPRNGRMYIAGLGNTNMFIGSTNIHSPKYAAAFDKDGTPLWVKQGAPSTDGFYGNIAIDKEGSIYIGGGTLAADTFAGYTTQFTGP